MTRTLSTHEAAEGSRTEAGLRAGLVIALVLDHAPENDGARARLRDIVSWLVAWGARHVTLVGAGEFNAPESLQAKLTLLAAERGREAVARAVGALIAANAPVTLDGLNAEIERVCGPPPDLILLIGEAARLDDAFAWSAAYAELFLLPAPWQALGEEDIARAIADFAARDRRFGALSAPNSSV